MLTPAPSTGRRALSGDVGVRGIVRMTARALRSRRLWMQPGTSPHLIAGAAATLATGIDVRVAALERMSVLAVRLPRLHGRRAHAPQEVRPSLDRLQVVRTDTVSYPAQMVDLESIRDRPDQRLVAVAMSQHIAVAGPAGPDHAVAACCRGSPEPAGLGLLNLRPEPLLDGRSCERHDVF